MEIMRVHAIRNILMDLIKDGKHPDEETAKEIKLGDGAGMNMLEKTADFTIVDTASEQLFEVYIKPLPRWVVTNKESSWKWYGKDTTRL